MADSASRCSTPSSGGAAGAACRVPRPPPRTALSLRPSTSSGPSSSSFTPLTSSSTSRQRPAVAAGLPSQRATEMTRVAARIGTPLKTNETCNFPEENFWTKGQVAFSKVRRFDAPTGYAAGAPHTPCGADVVYETENVNSIAADVRSSSRSFAANRLSKTPRSSHTAMMLGRTSTPYIKGLDQSLGPGAYRPEGFDEAMERTKGCPASVAFRAPPRKIVLEHGRSGTDGTLLGPGTYDASFGRLDDRIVKRRVRAEKRRAQRRKDEDEARIRMQRKELAEARRRQENRNHQAVQEVTMSMNRRRHMLGLPSVQARESAAADKPAAFVRPSRAPPFGSSTPRFGSARPQTARN